MKVIEDPSGTEVVLEFSSAEECDSFLSNSENQGNFFLEVNELPSNAVFRTRTVGSPRSRRIRPLFIKKEQNGYRVQTSAPAPAEEPVSAARASRITQQQTEQKPRNLFEKIRSMTVSERVHLAQKADLMERRVLMQENNSKINEFLLRNIRITEQEVAVIARNAVSPLSTILTIFHHQGWMKVDGIRSAILSNPKLPPHLALELMPRLSAGDVIKMSQAKYLREDVQRAVRNELKKRGIRLKETPSE
jgi:hypothetical protein